MKSILLAVAFLAVSLLVIAQPKVGSKAPEIALPDVNGQTVSLSSLQGKVVLIDFWASWCRPCRQSNYELHPVYESYKAKGFEVYGVSIDENANAWKAAIQQDNIIWLQVNDKEAAGGNDLTRIWAIRYIPTSFLLDKTGKVVAVNPSAAKLEKLLKKLLE